MTALHQVQYQALEVQSYYSAEPAAVAVVAAAGSRDRVVVAVVESALLVIQQGIQRDLEYLGIQAGGKEKGQRVVGAVVMTENSFVRSIEAVVVAAGNSLVVACEGFLNS